MTDDLVKRVDSLVVLLNMEREKSLSLGKHIEKLEAGEIEFDRIVGDYASENARFRDRIEKLETALRELSTDWDCCAVSKNMKLIASKALEGKDG